MGKKTGKVYVVGHKNPDTDSICSAIAYANLKKEMTGDEYVAKRAGQINEETLYVLKRFKVAAPELLSNVKLQVKDIDIHKIEGVDPNVSIKATWEKMKEQNVKTLPILKDEELVGVISTGDIATSYMDVYDSSILSVARTQYRNIASTIDGEIINGNEHSYLLKGKVGIMSSSRKQVAEFIEENDLRERAWIFYQREGDGGSIQPGADGGVYREGRSGYFEQSVRVSGVCRGY